MPFGWQLGFHYHIVGFLKGGYRCRDCKKASCSGCSGHRELWEKERLRSGWVLKVAVDKEGNAGRRISVLRTVYYQLEHSTIDLSAKRSHPLTWFGELSYRKLHVKIEKRMDVCPLCGSELVKLIYWGREPLIKDKKAQGYKGEFFADLYDANGSERFIEAPSGRYGVD